MNNFDFIKKKEVNKLKRLRPVTPSSRGVVLVNKCELLWNGKPFKSLTKSLKKSGGRNNQGRMTVAGIGGGLRKKYRIIDFKRNTAGFATIERIEYDPNRTSFIALIKYDDTNTYSYIIATNQSKVGDKVQSGNDADILPGNCLQLEYIPIGTIVHNVELCLGKGGQIAKSAGAFVRIVNKENGVAFLEMPSGEGRLVSLKCRATIGIVSNQEYFNQVLGKAGRNRNRGYRSKVRGVAKNPVDHHNGGRTSGGKIFGNFRGNMRKGQRTRKPQLSDKFIYKRRK